MDRHSHKNMGLSLLLIVNDYGIITLLVLMHGLSCVSFLATPWTVACQTPLSMRFSRQEYWRGLPFPSSGDLPNSGIEPVSLASPVLAGRFFFFFYHCITWVKILIFQLQEKGVITLPPPPPPHPTTLYN